jgi:hypothetical protein
MTMSASSLRKKKPTASPRARPRRDGANLGNSPTPVCQYEAIVRRTTGRAQPVTGHLPWAARNDRSRVPRSSWLGTLVLSACLTMLTLTQRAALILCPLFVPLAGLDCTPARRACQTLLQGDVKETPRCGRVRARCLSRGQVPYLEHKGTNFTVSARICNLRKVNTQIMLFRCDTRQSRRVFRRREDTL